MLHNVTKMTEIALNFHKSKKFFFSKEFYVDKEIGRAYTSFLRRDVAQSGSALEWGSRGRRFKSFHPDQKAETPRDLRKRRSLFCFGDLPFSPLTFLVAFFLQGQKSHTTKTFHQRSPGMEDEQSPHLSTTDKKSHGAYLRGFFAYYGIDAGRRLAAFPVILFSAKSSPKGDPRVPFPQPSGKGVSWSNDLQPRPAF